MPEARFDSARSVSEHPCPRLVHVWHSPTEENRSERDCRRDERGYRDHQDERDRHDREDDEHQGRQQDGR
jgi:hypothetical protein